MPLHTNSQIVGHWKYNQFIRRFPSSICTSSVLVLYFFPLALRKSTSRKPWVGLKLFQGVKRCKTDNDLPATRHAKRPPFGDVPTPKTTCSSVSSWKKKHHWPSKEPQTDNSKTRCINGSFLIDWCKSSPEGTPNVVENSPWDGNFSV